jgi:hypothetical protein
VTEDVHYKADCGDGWGLQYRHSRDYDILQVDFAICRQKVLRYVAKGSDPLRSSSVATVSSRPSRRNYQRRRPGLACSRKHRHRSICGRPRPWFWKTEAPQYSRSQRRLLHTPEDTNVALSVEDQELGRGRRKRLNIQEVKHVSCIHQKTQTSLCLWKTKNLAVEDGSASVFKKSKTSLACTRKHKRRSICGRPRTWPRKTEAPQYSRSQRRLLHAPEDTDVALSVEDGRASVFKKSKTSLAYTRRHKRRSICGRPRMWPWKTEAPQYSRSQRRLLHSPEDTNVALSVEDQELGRGKRKRLSIQEVKDVSCIHQKTQTSLYLWKTKNLAVEDGSASVFKKSNTSLAYTRRHKRRSICGRPRTWPWKTEAPQYSRSQRRLVGLISCRSWLFLMDGHAFPEAIDASPVLLSRASSEGGWGQGCDKSHYIVLIMINDK